MKKILNKILLLALFVLVPAFIVSAEDTNTTDSGTNAGGTGTITINNAIEGHTYTIYQVLQLESYDNTKKAYTYKIADGWEDFFDATKTEGKGAAYVTINDTKDSEGVVTWKDLGSDEANEAAAKTFAQLALKYANDKNLTGTAKTVADDGDEKKNENDKTVEFTGLNLGYYLVDSSVGALCHLRTTKPNATLTEKNSVPTVSKEVKREKENYAESNTASIGDTLYFKTTINVTAGAENYILYDKMDAGLTFDGLSSIEVYLNGETEDKKVDSTDYVATECSGDEATTCTFKIDFTDNFEKDLESGDTIYVTYTAKVNENAVIKDTSTDDKNENETYLKYGDGTETTHDKTTTYVYKFDLVKTDVTNILLKGAEFKLYDSQTNGNEIKVVDNGDGTYRLAFGEEKGTTIVVTDGKVTIKGLGKGVYWLEETKAPNGFNKLTSRIKVEIIDANLDATISTEEETIKNENTGEDVQGFKYESGGIHVINYTGKEMPETGGMGTILFITIGSIMVLGFGVLLVTKLRMSKMSA